MPEKYSKEEVKAIGVSSGGTVHFVKTESGEPVYDGKINSSRNIDEGYETFCGEYLDENKVFLEKFDEKVDEFVDQGKHFCKSCRSSVRLHRDDIYRTDT